MANKNAEGKKKSNRTGSGASTADTYQFIRDLRNELIARYMESGIGGVDKKEIAFLQAVQTSALASDGVCVCIAGTPDVKVAGSVDVKGLGAQLDGLTEAVSAAAEEDF